jgi:hypothetical protein
LTQQRGGYILRLLMADEKTKKAPKKTAPAAAKAAKAVKAAPEGPTCTVEKCKQPQRAKGLCRKHFLGWRRGKVGKKFHYKICSKEACRKPALLGGRCEEHKKGKKVEAAAAA